MSFDPLARHYHWMERVLAGEKLQRCRARWLPKVLNSQNILLIGEGHGRFLTACAQAMPHAKITCVDASARMLEIARNQLTKAGLSHERINLIHASVPNVPLPRQAFDLIVTNFFLDCFDSQQLPTIINSLATAAAPQATWLISEFHEPPTGWKRLRAKAILTLAYTFFRFATKLPARRLPNYPPLLREHHFTLQRRALFDWDLLTAELWRRGVAPVR
jgi:ubiquinone/menaquinone biosynthesis C-methylase UbiE